MTITTTKLFRTTGLCAVLAGLLFIGVQVNHPHLDVTVVTTTEYKVRQNLKVLMAALSLLGITGMYLRQVTKMGVLGLLGFVLPSLADSAPGYVNDVLAAATGGTVIGDIGVMQTAISLMGITYLGGGFIFGIALFRANVLPRWSAALLAVGTVSTIAISVLPQVNERLFAIPTGVALAGLGHSLWREQRTPAARPTPSPATSQLDSAGAK